MIDELFDRNVAWATGKTRSDPDYFRRLAEQQAPRYLWLGCSDSRVPANDIVGLDPGEVFVHRNVGNIVHTGDMNLLSVLEFAVETLQVKHVIVCGHYGCGGIRRAFEPPGGGGLVDHWLAPVREMCRRCAPDLDRLPNDAARMDRACELNVELQLRRIAATPILRGAWQRQQSITVHGWIYGLGDGLLRDLGLKLSSLDDAESLDRENDYAGTSRADHHGPPPCGGSIRGAIDAGTAASGGGLTCRTICWHVPTAILSRLTAGTRGKCLIVNLPGRPSAIDVCLNAVFPAISFASI